MKYQYTKLKSHLKLLIFTLSACSTPVLAADDALSVTQFNQCLQTLKADFAKKGIRREVFEQHVPHVPEPSVITLLNHQPEFSTPIWDYMAALVDVERIQDGARAKHQNAHVLSQIEARFGVDANHILGVWGVESNFGQALGKRPLFESLSTLSCFGRRQSYFKGEFLSALKIVQNGDIAAADMKGSWAGAFGQTQFMPSTFLSLAVDFDGDGRRNIVSSNADALASTANFLKNSGYKKGEVWGYEVKLNGYSGTSGRKNKKPIGYWQSMGLSLPNGAPLPNHLSQAALLLPAGSKGPAFLVGKNFDTFYSYNASEKYALAIAHLSDLIAKNSTHTEFMTPWPTDDAGISRAKARQVQQKLLSLGYNIGAIDGVIGESTRRAIADYQRKNGMPADGRAGQKLYQLMMRTK